MRTAFAALAFAILAAGCFDGDTTPPTSGARDACGGYTKPTMKATADFNGDNAFGHVVNLSCDFSVTPPIERARVPGTAGRVAAADYLAQGLGAAGWTVQRIGFTGRDYDKLPKGGWSGEYARGTRYCSEPDYQRMLDLSFENVVADLGTGNHVTLFMAHYDSKRFASMDGNMENRTTKPVLGANDGASGVAVLLEAARVLSYSSGGQHLRFLFVDGEDGFEDCHPLAGSIHYAQSHRALPTGSLPLGQEQIDRVVLLDMVGDPNARFCTDSNHEPLREWWLSAARNVSSTAFSSAGKCPVVDDHTAFKDAGHRVLDVIDYAGQRFPPYWHTTHDTPDKLTPGRLGETGKVVLEAIRSTT